MPERRTTLILIRHSIPEVDPFVAASEWRLSDAGLERCVSLASELAKYRIDAILSSTEPKASGTAEIIAEKLGVEWQIAPGLHEHLRQHVGFLGRREFESRVAEFFNRPYTLVLGEETADQAYQRFANAIDSALLRYAGYDLAIVTHGTVLTLFLSRKVGLQPVEFWKQLGMPAFVVVQLPEFEIVEIVDMKPY